MARKSQSENCWSKCEFAEGTYEFRAYVETTNGDVITAVDTVYIAL